MSPENEAIVEKALDEVERSRHRRGLGDLQMSHMSRFIRTREKNQDDEDLDF